MEGQKLKVVTPENINSESEVDNETVMAHKIGKPRPITINGVKLNIWNSTAGRLTSISQLKGAIGYEFNSAQGRLRTVLNGLPITIYKTPHVLGGKTAIKVEDVPLLLDEFAEFMKKSRVSAKTTFIKNCAKIKDIWLVQVLKQKSAVPTETAPINSEQNLFNDNITDQVKNQFNGNTPIDKFLRIRNVFLNEGFSKQDADSMAVEAVKKQTGKDLSGFLS